MTTLVPKWIPFIRERFHPSAYVTMIACFSFSLFIFAESQLNEKLQWYLLPLLFLMFLPRFFIFRCFDEIKDYEHDLVHNPNRPLARGLVSHHDLTKAIILCHIFEVFIAIYLRHVFHILVVVYTLIMAKEFFLRDTLRSHLTTYALLHTWVVVVMTSAMLYTLGIQLNEKVLYFSLGQWGIFNYFEFARKTYSKIEEKESVDSYSKIFGIYGAASLSLSQILLTAYCFTEAGMIRINNTIFFILPFLVITFIYILNLKNAGGKAFRLAAGPIIIIIYSLCLLEYLL